MPGSRAISLLLLLVGCVLTSTVNRQNVTDGATTPARNASGVATPTGRTSATPEQSTRNTAGYGNTSVVNGSLEAEGGPIPITPATHPSVLAQSQEDSKGVSDEEEPEPKKPPNPPKIVPRKGASQAPYPEKPDSPPGQDVIQGPVKPVTEPTLVTVSASVSPKNVTVNATTTAGPSAASEQAKQPSRNSTEAVTVSEPASKATPAPKKHKPKPTATVVNSRVDDEKPMPPMPTRSTPLGMPRKIDYIVPVIITIVTLPLLGAATYMVYRRGRDCWDKRHYRRMDFLIDGMYND